MGESAGGSIVDALLQSSAFSEEHLFQRVVISSGVAANPANGLTTNRCIVEKSLALLRAATKGIFGSDGSGGGAVGGSGGGRDGSGSGGSGGGSGSGVGGNLGDHDDVKILPRLQQLKNMNAIKLVCPGSI